MAILLPAPPRDRLYTEAQLDELLAGQTFTFDDLVAALVLVVPPLEALSYLRSLSARRALGTVGALADGQRRLVLDRDAAMATC